MQRPLATGHASLKLHWKGWAVISREGFLIEELRGMGPDPPYHVVEGSRQLAGLVVRVHGHLNPTFTRRKARFGLGQRPERRAEPTCHPNPEERHEQGDRNGQDDPLAKQAIDGQEED